MQQVDTSKVDIRLAVTDTPRSGGAVKIQCREPNHQDSEHSMAVYPDGIKCFGCGLSLPRTMEALAYLLFNDERRWRDALRVADQYIGREEVYREKKEVSTKPLPRSRAKVFARTLWSPARRSRVAWLQERMLTAKTIKGVLLGHTGLRFTIPVFDKEKQLVTIRFRRDDAYTRPEEEKPTPKYTGITGRNGLYLYPEWLIAEQQSTALYVWEGELDTLLSWQLGMQAITITNGANNLCKLPGLVRERLPFVQKLIIGADMDEAGEQARKEVRKEAQALGFETSLIGWHPKKGKDLTDYISNGFSLLQ